jgi:hypothetical protein
MLKKIFFLSVMVRLSAVVLFFRMKTHNASISTGRYWYRYPCYITLAWYGMFMQKLREEIECIKKAMNADPVPAVKQRN